MSFSYMYIFFAVLGLCVFMGDTPQSIVIAICGGGILTLYLHDWLINKTKFTLDRVSLISWIVFFLILTISSMHSLSLGYALSNTIRYICAFLLYVYFSNKTNKMTISVFFEIFFYWILIILFISYIYSLSPFLQQRIPSMNLIYKSFGHNHIVDLLFFVIPYASYLLLQRPTVQHFTAVIFLLFGLVTSFSRGAVIVLCMGFLLYIWNCSSGYKKASKLLLTVIILMVGFIILNIYSHANSDKISLLDSGTMYEKASIFESRIPYWTQAAESIRVAPWFGQGPGTFALISKKFQQSPNGYSWYAHSFPIQITAELGIFGGVLMGFLLYTSLHAAGIRLRYSTVYSSPRIAAYFGVILVLLYSIIEMNLDFSILWILFWVILGLLYRRPSFKKADILQISGYISIMSLLLFFYVVSALLGTYHSMNNDTSKAATIMPYNASMVAAYLTGTTSEKTTSSSLRSYMHTFHAHNSDILSLLAFSESDIDRYNGYMREAISSDPHNRDLLERYIKKTLKEERNEDLRFVLEVMVASISVDKKRDKQFLDTHWKIIHECFNSNTLIWNDSPFMDTYPEKSLYFAALCLIQKNDLKNAKELLRIATDSRPSWSYIYVDYAALVWWNEMNYEGAMRIIAICKENRHARQHCSGFDTGDFLSYSVYDPTVILEK